MRSRTEMTVTNPWSFTILPKAEREGSPSSPGKGGERSDDSRVAMEGGWIVPRDPSPFPRLSFFLPILFFSGISSCMLLSKLTYFNLEFPLLEKWADLPSHQRSPRLQRTPPWPTRN